MTTLYGLTEQDIAELSQPEDSIHFLRLLYDTKQWSAFIDQDMALGLLGIAFALGRLKGREDSAVTFIVREEG